MVAKIIKRTRVRIVTENEFEAIRLTHEFCTIVIDITDLPKRILEKREGNTIVLSVDEYKYLMTRSLSSLPPESFTDPITNIAVKKPWIQQATPMPEHLSYRKITGTGSVRLLTPLPRRFEQEIIKTPNRWIIKLKSKVANIYLNQAIKAAITAIRATNRFLTDNTNDKVFLEEAILST